MILELKNEGRTILQIEHNHSFVESLSDGIWFLNTVEIIQACLELAERLSINVRYAPLTGTGGLCTVKGKQVLYVNQSLPRTHQLEVLLHGLSQVPLDDVYVLPVLRELLDQTAGTKLESEVP